MKKLISVIFFLQFTSYSFCQVFISCEIKNSPDTGEISVSYYNNILEWEKIVLAKSKINSQEKYLLLFKINKSINAKLLIGNQYTNLFLHPTDSIHITVDFSKFDETINYSGRGAAENNYLAAELRADFMTKADRYSWFNDADKYKKYVDSIENLNQEFLKSYNNAGFSEDFKSYITTSTKYRFINSRYMFKTIYDDKTKKFSTRDLAESYFDFLKTLNLNDQQASENVNYNSALGRYLSEFNDHQYKNAPDSLSEIEKKEWRISINYNFRKTTFKEKVLDFQLTSFMKYTIEYNSASKIFMDELLKDYKSTCKNEEYISIIEKSYSQAIKMAAGNPAPDFRLINSNGEQVSLSSFKGKTIYLDFWATWCLPCMISLPDSENLMKKFKNRKDVVFLFVNVRDDFESWKKFLREEKRGGVQLFANEVQYTELSKSYNLNGIPRFVLIDKKGNFIDDNAARPDKIENELLEASK